MSRELLQQQQQQQQLHFLHHGAAVLLHKPITVCAVFLLHPTFSVGRIFFLLLSHTSDISVYGYLLLL